MSYWQREYVREAVTMTLNQTYVLELPKQGLLGSILLRFSGSEASGLGQSGGAWRLIDFLSKIEVLGDSATVVKSLTGLQAQALSVKDQHVMPPSVWKNYATNTQWEFILINFGRKLYDRGMGLDLSKFNVTELKITNTATASYFSDIAVSVVGIYLREPEGAGFPLGYMRSEQWRAWTTVADKTEYNDIPTEHLLRRILLQAIPDVDSDYVEETNMWNLADDVDLTLESGKLRLFKGGIDDLMRENWYHMGVPMIATGSEYMNADKGVDISLGYVMGGAWGQGSADGAVGSTIACMETGRTSFTQKPETYEADHPIGFVFVGCAPFLVASWDFDDDPDPGTWLDPEARKVVQMNVHTRNSSSAADGANSIILDRLVR